MDYRIKTVNVKTGERTVNEISDSMMQAERSFELACAVFVDETGTPLNDASAWEKQNEDGYVKLEMNFGGGWA